MSIVPILGKVKPAILQGKGQPVQSQLGGVSTWINGRKSTKSVILPYVQQEAFAGRNERVTYTAINAVPSNAFTTGAQYDFIMRSKTMKRITGLEFLLTVTETNSASMILCPVSQFVQRLEIYSTVNGTQMITRQYGDTLLFKEWALLSTEKAELHRKYANYSSFYNSTNEQTHKASEVKVYRLQLLDNILELLNVDFQCLNQDILFRFYFRNGIVVSGSGVPSLTSMIAVASESDDNGNIENEAFGVNLIRNNIMACSFLEPQVYEEPSDTLTQGATLKISMKSFRGNAAFLTVHVRASGGGFASAATNGFLTNNIDLGPGATLDIVTASNMALIGNGTPVAADHFLYQEWIKHFESVLPKHQFIYTIPFCQKMEKALEGQVNGFLQFNDQEKYLYICPDANAPVSEVQTVTASGTSASGQYQFNFKDWTSANLAYNANTTAMNTALNATDGWFYKNGLSCACSAAATASFTVTISVISNSNGNLDKLDGSLIQVINNNCQTSAPAAVGFTTVRTTVGRRGFTTGSYAVSIYCWAFNNAYLANEAVLSTI